MVFTPFDAAAVLIVLAAILGYLNHRVFRWPQSVGLTVMGAVASLVVIAVDRAVPGNEMAAVIAGFLDDINFRTTLMDGLLSFLLFAGALHVDWEHLRRSGGAVTILSTVGVILSTGLVAVGFHLLSGLFGSAIPWLWCFVFGALISPTDPVAVMGVLKRADVSPALQATVMGAVVVVFHWSSETPFHKPDPELAKTTSATHLCGENETRGTIAARGR